MKWKTFSILHFFPPRFANLQKYQLKLPFDVCHNLWTHVKYLQLTPDSLDFHNQHWVMKNILWELSVFFQLS